MDTYLFLHSGFFFFLYFCKYKLFKICHLTVNSQQLHYNPTTNYNNSQYSVLPLHYPLLSVTQPNSVSQKTDRYRSRVRYCCELIIKYIFIYTHQNIFKTFIEHQQILLYLLIYFYYLLRYLFSLFIDIIVYSLCYEYLSLLKKFLV